MRPSALGDFLRVYAACSKIKFLPLVRGLLSSAGASLFEWHRNQSLFLQQGPGVSAHSEKTGEMIDSEILELIHGCYEDAKGLLRQHHDKLVQMAQLLLAHEKMDEKDVLAILGARPTAREVRLASVREEKGSR